MSFSKTARLLAIRGARMVQSRSYSDEMKLTFAAANKTFYDAAVVRQIDVPSFSGSFGILAKHVPTLGMFLPLYGPFLSLQSCYITKLFVFQLF